MTYGELLYEIPNSLRELIRSLEKESRKLIKAEWSAKYYTSCLYTRVMNESNLYVKMTKLLSKTMHLF